MECFKKVFYTDEATDEEAKVGIIEDVEETGVEFVVAAVALLLSFAFTQNFLEPSRYSNWLPSALHCLYARLSESICLMDSFQLVSSSSLGMGGYH